MRRLSLSVLLLAGWALGEDEGSLARYLPASTPVYVEVRNPAGKELEGMALSRILEDPRLRALYDSATDEENSVANMRLEMGPQRGVRIRSRLFGAPSAVAVDVTMVDEAGEHSFRIQNRFAFAWTGFTEGAFPPELVAALEVDTDPRQAVKTIERLAAAASLHMHEKKGSVDAEIERLVNHGEHRGVRYSWVELGDVRLHLAPVGRLLVVSTSEARIKDMIDRQADGAKDSLAQDPRHRRMLEAPGTGTATTQIAIHIDRALAALDAHMPPVAMQIRGALLHVGLKDLESLTTVARVDGEGFTATTGLHFAGPERLGLARIFGKGKPARLGCLDFAPKDTLYVNCGTLDTKGLYQTLLEVGGMGVAMAQGQFEGAFGLKLREDLLDLLGPEAALIVAANRGLVPDVALVCESPDAERLRKSLLHMLSKADWPEGTGVRTFRIRDVTVHSVPLGHRQLAGFPVAPTFGVVDGHLVVAPYPMSFQRLLAVKRGESPPLAQNRDFQKLRPRVPAGAQGLSYLDLARTFDVIYATAVPFLQALPDASPSQLHEWPDADVFSRHLFGRIAWRVADDRTFQWQSYSALDTSGFLLSSLIGGAVAFSYATGQQQAQAQVAVLEELEPPARGEDRDQEARTCRHRVRLLRARLRLYEQEQGRLPDKLEDLEAGWLGPETFVVPGTDEERYVYLGPKGKGAVLLHGYANGEDGLVSVITKRMRTLRVTEEDLRRYLEGRAAEDER